MNVKPATGHSKIQAGFERKCFNKSSCLRNRHQFFAFFQASGDKRDAKSPGLLGVSRIRHRSSGVPYKRESPTLPDETKFEPVLEAGI